ncbi:MAG: hypothetical protein CMI31_10810 [Opitutae bacterium]|nr:hypothetical protein [Opitutae bacterium]
MPKKEDPVAEEEEDERIIFGLTQRQRYKVYAWGALAIVVGAFVWSLSYLRPWRWHTYTDDIRVKKVARDVELGYVLWEDAKPVDGEIADDNFVNQTVISSDGARMVYVNSVDSNNTNLFLRLWDGSSWGEPRPMRALNSKFHENSPALSGDGNLLVFASNRPGGQGGSDIWISKWDGAEYAWPLPLSKMVNTPFDEIDPAITPDGMTLFFASNQPHQATDISEADAKKAAEAEVLENVDDRKVDFDIFSADVEQIRGLFSERQLSILYSLREGALADTKVMAKLGGSQESEAAVDKALALLASLQEEDGRWDIAKSGGQGGHDVAATAFSLLAFYGRGERHDVPCKYRENVRRGLDWLLNEQDANDGDLRGKKPKGNMYDHGIGALALVEAYGVTKDTGVSDEISDELEERLETGAYRAIEFIQESQHEEGGWRYKPGDKGDLSVTGWMVMALASGEMSGIAIPKKTRDGIKEFLDHVSGGKHGGGYGYTDSQGTGGSKAMNAVGFFCAQLLGSSANAAKAFESSLILNKNGFDLNDIYYGYYGTLAAYQHQGPTWRKWLDNMHAQFIKTQAEDGSWDLKGSHSNSMGTVVKTALVALCLEAHYRYTPLYGLGFEPDSAGPSSNVLEGDDLPKIPIFRMAKHLPLLSSPGEDTAPVITDHGDFLYFASTREDGFGGSDIYRSRLVKGVAWPPVNLGKEINGKDNESHPAVRMAGFHLLFNSDRDGNEYGLYDARSKRVVRRFDYSQTPDGAWFGRNAGWLFGFVLSGALLIYLCLRAFRKPIAPQDEQEKAA